MSVALIMPFCFNEQMFPEDISSLTLGAYGSNNLANTTLTFDIFVLLSPVRNARLLISCCTTKFCSSLLKFYEQRAETSSGNLEMISNS